MEDIILIEVPEDAKDFVVDNAIEFLVFRIPNLKNWVTDDVLQNYDKLQKYLATTNQEDDWLTSGKRLHGKHKLLGTLKNGIINFMAPKNVLSKISKEAGDSNKKFVVLKKI